MARTKTQAAAQPIRIETPAPAAAPIDARAAEAQLLGLSFDDMSGRRATAAFLGYAAASVLTVYAGTAVATLISAAAVALTGVAFLGTVVYVLGMILTVYAAMVVGRKTLTYIALGGLERDVATVTTRVGRFLHRNEREITDAIA